MSKGKLYVIGSSRGVVIEIDDFSKRLTQPDLKLAYEDSTKYSGKMPFSLGYHWGGGVQNYMLYTKIK